MAIHRAEVTRRLETPVVVQLDEPSLPAALAGRLSGVTSFTPVHPADEPLAMNLIDACVAAAGTEVALHSCAPELPWKALLRSAVHAVSVDVSTLTPADLDGVGEFVDSGRTVLLGVVPSVAPEGRPSFEEVAKAAVSLHRPARVRAGRAEDRIGITPTCGLAGPHRSGRAPRWNSRRRLPTPSPKIRTPSRKSNQKVAFDFLRS